MPKFRVSFDVEAESIEDVQDYMGNEVDVAVAKNYYGMRLWTPVIEPWVTIPED